MPAQYGLRVNQFDRVSSLLLALVVLVGATVVVLAVIWLSGRIFLRQEAVPVEFEQIGTGGEGPLDQANDLSPPDVETTDPTQPQVADRLSAVVEAISDQAALLEDPAEGSRSQAGIGGSGGTGIGGGTGTGRPLGWELAFPAGVTLDNYARQLDHFGIELGVVLPGNRVAYASDLSSGSPTQRIGPADADNRIYLTWRSGPLQQADRELLRRAGIDPSGRMVLKFLPPELAQRMAGLEQSHARQEKGEGAEKRVRRTRFGVVPRGDGWDLIVFEQSYR